jgi:hypothetical protein
LTCCEVFPRRNRLKRSIAISSLPSPSAIVRLLCWVVQDGSCTCTMDKTRMSTNSA